MNIFPGDMHVALKPAALITACCGPRVVTIYMLPSDLIWPSPEAHTPGDRQVLVAAVGAGTDAICTSRSPALDAIGQGPPGGCHQGAILHRKEAVRATAKSSQHLRSGAL